MYNFQQLIKDLNSYSGCKTPPFPVCMVTLLLEKKKVYLTGFSFKCNEMKFCTVHLVS